MSSRRQWDGLVKHWKRAIHKFGGDKPTKRELFADDTKDESLLSNEADKSTNWAEETEKMMEEKEEEGVTQADVTAESEALEVDEEGDSEIVSKNQNIEESTSKNCLVTTKSCVAVSAVLFIFLAAAVVFFYFEEEASIYYDFLLTYLNLL